ncbi:MULTISPECIES: sulfate transporter CysZ [Vibrio]|uniref:Sulfate transporter CysZ n=2 Tax=Vibrio TaxID=662 RepID=A0A7X4RUX7_9VIBR|nr:MULTISPECIES: sulfate transporter CysZ [Vibrio]MBF8999803.1 sulfate transporter CysZ [Vibrio nitrifigilis]MZI93564.1 sulfate transporter CysZ [Vibrio eleionomae]
MQPKQRSGFGYFFFGLELAFAPDIRRFVILPLLANIILVGGALYFLFDHLGVWIDQWMQQLPDFLSWLSYLLWPLLVITILATFSYFFSTLANFIAAPFNGLLAEKVEIKLTQSKPNDDGVLDVIKDIPRVMSREWRKLVYVVPKALGLFILMLIPALGQTIGPIAWFIFTAWTLAIQYCDYPFDNHKIDFHAMRNDLKQKQGKAYGFGIIVSVLTTIPIVNLFVVPVAVCGATAMWVAEFQHQHKTK